MKQKKLSEKSPRGRPKGRSAQGLEMQERLYSIALKSFEKKGFAATTLRDIASEAGVTAGLLYKYFPSKEAIILNLYNELSMKYASDAEKMLPGLWRMRFLFALRTSLKVLGPHRQVLKLLTPILVGDESQGLFSAETAFSRARVESVFASAISGASDALPAEDAKSLGRVLYVVHLAVILWWLLDKSPNQRATQSLVSSLEKTLPFAALSLKVGKARKAIRFIEQLCTEGLFGEK